MTVIVLDELESMSTGTLSVTVNLPPVLTAIGPQTVQAGQALAIKPSATDPNDADLVYTPPTCRPGLCSRPKPASAGRLLTTRSAFMMSRSP